MVTLITPAYAHIQQAPCTSAGAFLTMIVGAIGVHVPAITGTQGIGVSTPNAAAVAAATVGFAIDMHMPKGIMLTHGLQSMILAAGKLPAKVPLIGGTSRADGAIPNEHLQSAPLTTSCGICYIIVYVFTNCTM